MQVTPHYFILSARLNFPAEKATFRIQDNPLIHALDEKLQTAQTSSVKLLFEYLKSEEYREWVWSDSTASVAILPL